MNDAISDQVADSPPDIDDPMRQAVVVQLGETQFGIPIDRVHEVLHVPPITRLPFPPPSVLGVVNVRGVVLPIIDLGDRIFGVPAKRDGRIVVVTESQSRSDIALLVDQVIDLVPLDIDSGDLPPELAASLPAGWIDSVISPGPDRLVTLLNLEPVLTKPDPADEER